MINGNLTFNEAGTKYSDDESAKYTGPYLTGRDGSTFVTIDMLDKAMVGLLTKMKVGEYSKPVEYESEQGKKGVRIVHLKSRTEPHRLNMNDDYSKISQFALEEKKSKTLDKWLQGHLPMYYVNIDPQTAEDCPLLKKFEPKN